MAGSLPFISGRSQGGASQDDSARVSGERIIPDERLGISGFYAQGAMVQHSQEQGKYRQLAGLGEAMGRLDGQLRDALQERADRNADILQSLKDATRGVLPEVSQRRLLSTSMPGALFHAAVAGGITGSSSRPSSAGGAQPRAPSSPRLDVSARIGDARWGSSEGGRDHLGWVRSLVRYTEAHPIYAPDDRSTDVAPAALGFKKTVFPSLKPDRREDVALLQHWLEDMVKQLSGRDLQQHSQAQVHGGTPPLLVLRPPEGPASVTELSDGTMHIYSIALEELKRQVSSECKERGELLSALCDHIFSLVELRCGLMYEDKLSDMQAQYMRVMAAKEKLEQDVTALETTLVETGNEKSKELADAASQSRSLALKLVQAQAAAESVQKSWKVADMALQNEVTKRLEADQLLSHTKELLNRTEHDWLHYRSINQKLEAQNKLLAEQLQQLQRELEVAGAAQAAAHERYEALAASKAGQEVDIARTRREWETNEILVVSLKQQVQDLEAQMAQLKAFSREHALQLAALTEDKEQLEADKEALGCSLEEQRGRSQQLEQALERTELQLQATSVQLQLKEHELAALQESSHDELRAAKAEIDGLTVDVRQLRNELADVTFKLQAKEIQWTELHMEYEAIREMLISMSKGLIDQGVDGAPNPSDKTWGVMGPLGGAQKTTAAASRQLGSLWERLEGVKRENEVLSERLQEELKMQNRLQTELYESRTAEVMMLKSKEEGDLKLDVAEQKNRVLENDKARLEKQLAEEAALNRIQLDSIQRLQTQVGHLVPFEGRCQVLESLREELEEKLKALEVAYAHAKEDLEQLRNSVLFYKAEVDKLVSSNGDMQEQLKLLSVVEAELEEVKCAMSSQDNEVAELQRRLEEAVVAHGETLRQLELAKFFLQGLESPPPRSPTHSARSPTAPRPATATSMHSVDERCSSAAALHSAASPSPPRSRPGTAPALALPGSRLATPLLSRIASERSLAPSSHHSRPQTAATTRSEGGMVEMLSVTPIVLPAGGDNEPGTVSPHLRGSFGGTMLQQLEQFGSHRPSSRGYHSRPLSAISNVSNAQSVYAADMPLEVVGMMEQRGLSGQIASSNLKWMKFKIQIMAWFSNKLRKQLVEEQERRVALEVQLVAAECCALEDAIRHDEFVVKDLLNDLNAQVERTRTDTAAELKAMRGELPKLRHELGLLANVSTVIASSLKVYKDRDAARQHSASQTSEALEPRWAAFIQGLPQIPPAHPLGHGALTEAIVRIYVRQVPTVSDIPVWGASRVDTIYDAIMEHYNSQRAPNLFSSNFLEDEAGPIARLFQSCQVHVSETKVATFAYLTGIAPDGVVWSMATWHFMLHVLHCLRVLLGGTWKSTVKQWATVQGVQLPVQVVYDVVGNLFNVQTPLELDGTVTRRLTSLVTPGAAGAVVDLDALLLLLINEYNAGNCPRNNLLFPRRLTDGSLFNIFNTIGHSPHISAIESAKATQLIGTSPPGSPYLKSRPVSGTTMNKSSRPATAKEQRLGSSAGGGSPRNVSSPSTKVQGSNELVLERGVRFQQQSNQHTQRYY